MRYAPFNFMAEVKGQSTFLEVPAMHRKEPASRDFLPARTSLSCCYATVASSWQKVAQRPHKHAIVPGALCNRALDNNPVKGTHTVSKKIEITPGTEE